MRQSLYVVCITMLGLFTAFAAEPKKSYSVDDVRKMVQEGVPANEIVGKLKHSSSVFELSPRMIESLLDENVPMKVLTVMADRSVDVFHFDRHKWATQEAAQIEADAAAANERCPNGKKVFFALVDSETGEVIANYQSSEELKGFLRATWKWTKETRPYCTVEFQRNANLIVLHTYSGGRHVYLSARRKDSGIEGPIKPRHHQSRELKVEVGLELWEVFLQIATGEVEASDSSAYAIVLDPKGVEMPYENGRNTFLVGIHGAPANHCMRETLEHLW
jgi:hypothetical protein